MMDRRENVSPLPLTVLVPVRNGQEFLAETLQSVLAQTHPISEIIVVNDGSTDNTAYIASSFGEKIRLVNRKNAGVSAARNYGLSIATTEWVALVDHDDLWEPNHLANIASVIAANPDADLCYTGARWMKQEGSIGPYVPGDTLNFPPAQGIFATLMERCVFMPSSVALKKSTALLIGGFDTRYTHSEDWDLWLRLLHNGAHFVHSPEPTLLYRVHPGSAAHNPLRGLRQSRDVAERDILPYLSVVVRAIHGRRVISRLEAEAAILLRENGLPGALTLMLRSIIRHPFHGIRRFGIATHMIFRGYPKLPSA